MGRKLFARGKIGVFVDGVASGLEKRRGGEAKVLRLALRVDSFDAALAGLIDEGLDGETNVRALLFRLDDGEPKPQIKRVDIALPCPRQRLDLYPTPDTEVTRLCFDHVKIDHFYVRTQKDSEVISACFRATFGPVGRDQLEAAHAAYRSQVFVEFDAAEPSLAFEDEEDTDDLEPDDDDDSDTEPHRPTAPMWDEPGAVVEPPPVNPPRLVKRGNRTNGKST